jgi:hypothetical protein
MSFASELRRFANKTNQKMETAVKSALIRVGTSVVVKSPVDEGRFINNWLAAYGTVDTSVSYSTDKSGQESIGRLKISVEGMNYKEVFYFTNSLPYAEKLEYGYSDKAPSGMVRVSVAAWENILAQEIRKIAR